MGSLSMATSAQVIDQLASVTGFLPSTVTRLLRVLRAVDLVPTGGRGGGKSSVHFEVGHLAYVLLGMAGHHSSDGPEAARMLAALPYTSASPLTDEQKATLAKAPRPCGTLEESLAAWIRFAAGELDASDPYDFRWWTLTLFPRSSRAIIGFDRNRTGYLFGADLCLQQLPPWERVTQLSGATLLTVARLSLTR